MVIFEDHDHALGTLCKLERVATDVKLAAWHEYTTGSATSISLRLRYGRDSSILSHTTCPLSPAELKVVQTSVFPSGDTR